MSLRFALLGLLAERPSSGYDLTQRFEEGIGAFAWTAKHSQIYPELTKLDAEGLVHVVSEGARGRRVFDVTAEGRDALRTWLLTPRQSGGTVRNEFVLRLFLLSSLDPADARQVLDGVAEFAAAQVDVLQAEAEESSGEGRPSSWGPTLAAMFGVYTYRATRDWARWASDQLPAGATPSG